MKNEVARREIEFLDYYLQNHSNDYSEESHTAMMMARDALKQEPYEDAISRKAVLEQTYSWSKDEFLRVTNPFYYLRKRIKALPPITPTQNTRQVARWVNNIHDLPICSKCGNYAVFDHAIDDYYYSDYCPKCGARMENAVEKIYKEGEK